MPLGPDTGQRSHAAHRAPAAHRAQRPARRVRRVAVIGAVGVLIAAGIGVTAYARTAGHPAPTATPGTHAAATTPQTPKSPATAARGAAGSQSALPMQSSTQVESTSGSTAQHVSNPLKATPFSGVAQVGTLFRTSNGALTSHHCTGSVVHSAKGDVVLTAAHCVYDSSGPETSLEFVPQYHDGSMPYGAWKVSAVYVASQWSASRDPDHDVAFITVHKDGSSDSIEDEVGSDRLAVDQSDDQLTTVIGYPSSTNTPVTCTNYTTEFSPTQLKFACAGYPGGTSGSPFLTHIDAATGYGTVDGVIGGYEMGGDTSSVSYSVHFDDAVEDLYQQAVRGG